MRRKLPITSLFILVFLLGFSFNLDDKLFEISKNLEIFTNVYKELNTNYVDEVDPGTLMKTGIDAMLNSLDPYTSYFSESQVESYRYQKSAEYDGIGARVKYIDEYVTIIEPYEGFAGFQAGLRAGDKIIAINGKNTKGKSTDEVGTFIKGVPGTEVNLTIERSGQKTPLSIVLIRGELEVPNVPYSGMIDENIGYIKLDRFTRNAGRNVSHAFRTLRRENKTMQGVVIDLRGNPGGLLLEAINLSNIFIPKGEVVVQTKGKVPEWDKSYKTMNDPIDLDIPLVILIDKNSASASEIVSGVIQDLDRGVIMGQRSYGKGLVQNQKKLGYNSSMKLTTSKYYIPSGRCIQSVAYENGEPVDIPDSLRNVFYTHKNRPVLDGGGVTPDIFVEPPPKAEILNALNEQDILFNYVTSYSLKLDTIDDPGKFEFEEKDGFKAYLRKMDFNYVSEAEKHMSEIEKIARTNLFFDGIDKDFGALKKSILKNKETSIDRYWPLIQDQIAGDLVSRYHFQKGRAQYKINHDLEIASAVNLLSDIDAYNKVLKK